MTLECSVRRRCGVRVRPDETSADRVRSVLRQSVTVLRRSVTALALGGAVLTSALALTPHAHAEMPMAATYGGAWGTASSPATEDPDSTVSTDVLNSADVARYKKIFALQEKARWKAADKIIKTLDDRCLMGHVLYQRYMHPTGWHSHARELAAWMREYSDLPGADKIHIMALRRGAHSVHRVTWNGLTGSGGAMEGGYVRGLVGHYASSVARRAAYHVWRKVSRALNSGYTLAAKRVLLEQRKKRTLAAVDYDRLSGLLAYSYFIDGHDQMALDWATAAIRRSGANAPMALWAAGLTAWRQGDVARAAPWFEVLSQAHGASTWLIAGGGYWAARAALRDHQPGRTIPFLKRAASHPRTFYGLLARRVLGLPSQIQWGEQALSKAELQVLNKTKAGHRAFALVQVGKVHLAEQELRGLYRHANDEQRDAILRAADVSGMSGLALYLSAIRNAAAVTDSDADAIAGALDSARYPVPVWQPSDGWHLDRALIFAFVRQESAFNPLAQSWAGARGLMQVMPATAAYIAGEKSYRYRRGRKALLSPELNLSLGQKYLNYLLGLPDVKGNLFYAAVAYNAGPGNLQHWKARLESLGASADVAKDPLMFIESIPIRETRVYVQRVMANLWMYRDRLGQQSPSLDMVASGDWPRYSALDSVGFAAASPASLTQ